MGGAITLQEELVFTAELQGLYLSLPELPLPPAQCVHVVAASTGLQSFFPPIKPFADVILR